MKTPLVLVCFAICTSAWCQVPNPLGTRLHVGYTTSGNFQDRGHHSVHLEGPEIGIDLPFQTLPFVTLHITPSVFFGGRLRHGSDTDGEVYRLMITAEHGIAEGIRARVGVGVASTQPRAHEFDGDTGAYVLVGFGLPIGGMGKTFHASLDVNLLTASSGQHRGWFVGVSGNL